MFWYFSFLLGAAFDSLPLFISSATLAFGVTMSVGDALGKCVSRAPLPGVLLSVCALSGLYAAGYSIVWRAVRSFDYCGCIVRVRSSCHDNDLWSVTAGALASSSRLIVRQLAL
jgi:hypothetical protein